MASIENFDVVGTIIEKITQEFQAILNSDAETYGGYNVVITNEQQYTKQSNAKPKTIFMVVKFLQGNRDYGQIRQPFTINAVSEHNHIGICQKLMMDFAQTYNLDLGIISGTNGYTMRQTMTTVSSVSNFNETYAGFRSVFYLGGTFYIGVNSNPITRLVVDDANHSFDATVSGYSSFTTTAQYVGSYVLASNVKTLVTASNKDSLSIVPGTTVAYVNGFRGEEINFLTAQFSYDAQRDSQPFYDTNNFNRTVNKVATLSLGFTMYSVDTTFFNECMTTIFNGSATVNIDKMYYINVYFKNKGNTPFSIPMKLASVSNVQEIRDFPATSFTFVR